MQVSMKLGQAMYEASQASGEAGEASAEAPKKDDVIDADFEEVDENEKKKRA
jgi:molecular chaperone DnaK